MPITWVSSTGAGGYLSPSFPIYGLFASIMFQCLRIYFLVPFLLYFRLSFFSDPNQSYSPTPMAVKNTCHPAI